MIFIIHKIQQAKEPLLKYKIQQAKTPFIATRSHSGLKTGEHELISMVKFKYKGKEARAVVHCWNL